MAYVGGFTNTADGLTEGDKILNADRRADATRIMIVVTDGKPTMKIGQEIPIAQRIRQNIRVIAVGGCSFSL